eukprot:ANDGO_08618.mRNA.1 COP9 signalosome complex subunit 1
MSTKVDKIPSSAFDVELYASQYTGRGLVLRLEYLARQTTDPAVRMGALQLAIKACCVDFELLDTRCYKELYDVLRSSASSIHRESVSMISSSPRLALFTNSFNQSWVDATDRKFKDRSDALNAQLVQCKANTIRESTRATLCDLSELFFSRGDLDMALSHSIGSKDYCTTSKHVSDMCISVIVAAFLHKQYALVLNYAQRAEQTPNFESDKVLLSKVKVACGLALMKSHRLKDAVVKFTECSPEMGDSFNQIVTMADVGRYAALCGLAALNRQELNSIVRSNIGFKDFLDAAPECRDALNAFYVSNFSKCFALLDGIAADLAGDYMIGELISGLLTSIRQRALLQYTVPYETLFIEKMANVFQSSNAMIIDSLSELIRTGQISARIDLERLILVKRTVVQKDQNLKDALKLEEELRDTIVLAARRRELENAGICVVDPRKESVAGTEARASADFYSARDF